MPATPPPLPSQLPPNPPQYGYWYPVAPPPPRQSGAGIGLSVAGLVLAVIGVAISWLPWIGVAAYTFAAIGLLLAIAGGAFLLTQKRLLLLPILAIVFALGSIGIRYQSGVQEARDRELARQRDAEIDRQSKAKQAAQENETWGQRPEFPQWRVITNQYLGGIGNSYRSLEVEVERNPDPQKVRNLMEHLKTFSGDRKSIRILTHDEAGKTQLVTEYFGDGKTP